MLKQKGIIIFFENSGTMNVICHLKEGIKMKIWYLYHSGFAVETKNHLLIFDYWRDTPNGGGLKDGVIHPEEIKNFDVVAFSSHNHGDHYNKKILRWGDVIERFRLVLSDDILKNKDALMVKANRSYEQPDFTLRTLLSNDEGVAFLLDIDGVRIYHAGDLNWWHWQGEPDDWNDEMAAIYKEQIALLGGNPIDLAFVPVDPRLGEQYAWGIDYIMKTADIKYVVPMHFGDDTSVVKRLFDDPISTGYRGSIVALTVRGQMAEIAG